MKLPVHSYERRSGSALRLTNLFAERNSQLEQGEVVLIKDPGVRSVSTVATGGFRGGAVFDNLAHVLIGKSLYTMSEAGTAIKVGEVPGAGAASLIPGRTQLGIITGGLGYVYDGTVTQITDTDFLIPGQADYLDGFLLATEAGTDKFFSSGLNDFAVYDPLDFAIAESESDKLVSLLVDHRQIILFGVESIELWWNAGLSGFPFERVPDGAIEEGCSAQRSPAKADNSVFFLDRNRMVRVIRDLTPQRVSTHATEEAFSKYSTVEDAWAFTYTHEGHINYCLNFPDTATWIYDITAGEWHERETLQKTYWDIDGHLFAYGKNWIFKDDQIGILDTTLTEFGTEIRSFWTYPKVWAQGKRARHKRLEIFCEVGAGPDNPQIGLDVSDDNGKTWEALPTKTLGKTGNYQTRVYWNKLGSSRNRIYRPYTNTSQFSVFETLLDVENARI